MKKYFLLAGCLINWAVSLSLAQTANQPILDIKTAEKLRHDMGTDGWHTLSFKHKTQFWIRQHFIDSLKTPKNSAEISYYNGNGTLAQLNATKEVELAVTSITPQTAGKYLYRVILNDSTELVHWTKPTVFKSDKETSYAYLGRFNCLNKVLKLEFYRVDDYTDRTEITFNGGYLSAPKIDWINFNRQSDMVFHSQYMETEFVKPSNIEKKTEKPFTFWNGAWHQHPIKIQLSDHISGLIIEMRNTIYNDMYAVWLYRDVDGKSEGIRIDQPWEHNQFGPNPTKYISSAYFNRPGNYKLSIGPTSKFKKASRDMVETISFTILPAPISVPLKQVMLITFIILTTAAYCFVIYRRDQNRKLARQAKDRQIATLQLASVRSQLNPHFIFNALAGIQNLMNKKDVEKANKYLSRFARLTRNVLDEGNNELTTIEKETSLLRDYLEMEQMRFGFKFKIDVDNNVDQQTQIPAMLLQPFVENAVKHGVSNLKEEGIITVSVKKTANVLTFTIRDNGNGFSTGNSQGMGIKLCSERIALLNSIYKNSRITLNNQSGSEGAVILVELSDWI